MKSVVSFFAGSALLIGAAGLLPAQDTAAARAAAERQETEERYQRLASTIENLRATQDSQQKRLATLTEELNRLREENTRSQGKYATPEDLSRLAEKIRELDKKREADKELILAEFAKLGKTITAAPLPGARDRTAPPNLKPTVSANRPETEKGYEYVVQKGDYLSTIVAAYNEQFKKEGKKAITTKQVEDANPGLNPSKMKIGQKIFVPLPPEK